MLDHARSETGNCSKRFRALLRISKIGAATAQRFATVDLRELAGEGGCGARMSVEC
ncbi:hypothetical protein [Paraburkholderia sp. J41]|uniref:hypothetical protein n=1 Tax=Paraburkholderia sp. J41 TaxID=2805433 RepID=UPI002AC3522D|nr:hypothetical protein [Paraburkholderia sp. J41]